MSLTREEVLRLAKLAKLELSSSEILHFGEQLSHVIDHFKELEEVNTENVLPTSQTTGLTNVLRGDSIDPLRILPLADIEAEATETHNGYFVVPAILTKDAPL